MNRKLFLLMLAAALTVGSLAAFLSLPGESGSAASESSGDAALASDGCPPEARVSVDGSLCPSSRVVAGRVTGVASGDATVSRSNCSARWRRMKSSTSPRSAAIADTAS